MKRETVQQFNDFLNKPGIPYERGLLKQYSKRVLDILEGKNPPPYELEIQPSAICNANCDHCFGRDFGRCEDRLYNKKNFDRVIDQVLNFKSDGFDVKTIKFCGTTGDPLCNPLTTYALDRISGEKFLRIFTNGISIGQHKNNIEYLKTISKSDRLDLSLDVGTTKKLHEIKLGAKRNRVSLENILEGIKKINNLSDIHIEVGYVITTRNYEEIVEATRKVKSTGAKVIRFRIDMTDRTVSDKHGKEITSLLEQAKQYKDKNFGVVPVHSQQQMNSTNIDDFSSRSCGFDCYVSKIWTCIGPNGNVYPCGHIVTPETKSYGNVLEKSILEIWESSQRKKVIDCLPGKSCDVCSPFSYRINEFLTFLSRMPFREARNLIEEKI